MSMQRDAAITSLAPPVGSGLGPTHVFVVRFWSEPREVEHASRVWRGVIEHVPSGERHALQRPNDVARVIGTYVGGDGTTKPGMMARIGRWMRAQSTRGIGLALCADLGLSVIRR
jgi:hypothetical protein